jgi:CRP/FNR family transcriptional regulator, cyclic AMP receptor protein
MIDRFQGPFGRRRLIEALRGQPVVEGNVTVASALADAAGLSEYTPGELLFAEGGSDNHIAFILSGAVSIVVSDRQVNTRQAGQHVGEMALIDPRARRSASVIALEPTVTASVQEPVFAEIADEHPRLWRRLAVELADRLRQRNVHVRPRSKVSRVFIGSSTETLPVAYAISGSLATDPIEPIVWAQGGVFGASQFPIESLDAQVEQADFAALVLGPDDVVVSRHKRVVGQFEHRPVAPGARASSRSRADSRSLGRVAG